MKPVASLLIAVLVAISGMSGVVAQSSPSIAEMEKERLRKAKEDTGPKITVEDVAAASAARKADPSLDYQADCAAKKATACFDLGNHYRNKNGKTPQDAVDEAVAYGLACQLNHPEGCFNFGEIKEKGQGLRVERDPKTALGAFARSCKLGFGNGCYNAAKMLGAFGVPPEQQAKKAEAMQALYKAGCELKNYYSCKAIGIVLPVARTGLEPRRQP